MRFQYYILVLLLLFPACLKSQEYEKRIANRASGGFQAELGVPTQYLRPGWHRYWLTVVGGSIYFPIYKSQSFFNIGMEFYPNVATGMKGPYREWEVGLNVRLNFNFSLSNRDLIAFKAASGPHYITVEANRQADGFVFSDYFLLSYKRGFPISNDNHLYFEMYTGLRHVSSAGINMPTDGINNWIIGIGIGKFLY